MFEGIAILIMQVLFGGLLYIWVSGRASIQSLKEELGALRLRIDVLESNLADRVRAFLLTHAQTTLLYMTASEGELASLRYQVCSNLDVPIPHTLFVEETIRAALKDASFVALLQAMAVREARA